MRGGKPGSPVARGTEAAARSLARRLPPPVRSRLRRAIERMPLLRRLALGPPGVTPPGNVRWGSLRRTTPLSRTWGFDRGTPIDRVYIEEFLADNAADVRGACLEVLNAAYTQRFGGRAVTSSDVLDIDPSNTAATIVADLGERDSLPFERFDCVILTQTLHLVPDMRVALSNAWHAVRPGGVLLITVPAVGRHESRPGFDHDRWRIAPSGLTWLIANLPNADGAATSYGNVLSCVAFLYGIAAEELDPDELRVRDPQFPLVVAARIGKERSA